MSRKSRYGIICGVGLVAVGGTWYYGDSLRNRITETAAFSNPAPPAELIEEIIEASPDRTSAIIAAWNARKIVQREAAVREISRVFPTGQSMPADIQSIVRAAALDPDMDVRETALAILQARKDSLLPKAATAQLRDADPQVRLLGLRYLRGVVPEIGVPPAVNLLDDQNPLIVASALKLLEHWSGENFGVRLSEAAPSEDPETGLQQFPEGSLALAAAGATKAKAWWAAHQSGFPDMDLTVSSEDRAAGTTVPAGDFLLPDLNGRNIALSDFRGKVVLINFWTTWCHACVGEIPELIALQKQHREKLVIVGISLDFVPDGHGHRDGHPALEASLSPGRKDQQHSTGLQKVREKVSRIVKERGINYTVLLDEKNEIGGRFNGGELPTTVIIDPNGNVNRRFIGARTISTFEAMVTEAARSTNNPAPR